WRPGHRNPPRSRGARARQRPANRGRSRGRSVARSTGVSEWRHFGITTALDMAPLWCHYGAMELEPYVDKLREQLAVAASAGGEDALSLAQRLTAALESAVRLTLLDALSVAAAE